MHPAMKLIFEIKLAIHASLDVNNFLKRVLNSLRFDTLPRNLIISTIYHSS